MKNITITRNCCTIGNCDDCQHNKKFGTPIRVIQAITNNPEYAKKIIRNWHKYQPKIEQQDT